MFVLSQLVTDLKKKIIYLIVNLNLFIIIKNKKHLKYIFHY